MLSAQIIIIYTSKMARRSRGRARRGRNTATSALASRTVAVTCSVAGVISDDSSDIEIGVIACPGLKAIIGAVGEWRVTQARAEYSTANPQAKGIVAMCIVNNAWAGGTNFESIVASGGVQFPACISRRSTPSVGGLADGWFGASQSAARVLVGTAAAKGPLGMLSLYLTIQVRGANL